MAYSFINSGHSANSLSLSYSPGAGNQVLIAVSDFIATGGPVASVTDNLSTVYSTAIATTQGSPSSYELAVFYNLNSPSGVTSYSVSFSGGTVSGNVALEILVLEYSGLAGFTGAAFNYVVTPGSGANTIVSNAINLNNVPAALVGIIFNPSVHTCSAGTSPIAFSARYTASTSGMFGEDARVLTSGNAKVSAGTVNSSNNFLVAAIGLFEAAASRLVGTQLVEQDRSIIGPRKTAVQEFWQVPVEIRSVAPAVMPTQLLDFYQPPDRSLPAALRGIELELVNSTLYQQDRVLTPVDWLYGWDPPQLPLALRSDSFPVTVNEMTQLTNYTPYTEYNWPVPIAVRQWNRGSEFSINLNLLGKDVILTGAPVNLQWDPPSRPRQLVTNFSIEQSGLALSQTVQIMPPISEANWLVPARARQPVQDFMQSTPTAILTYLTTYPAFAPLVDLPPKAKLFPATLLKYEYSTLAILKGQDVIPFGIRFDSIPPERIRFNRQVLSIEQASIFLAPVVTPPISTGAKHVGRVILPAVRVGEQPSLPFDFISGLLTPNETVVSASTTATLNSGTDTNPQAVIAGAATAAGSIAYQTVKPTIVGNVYNLVCVATTSAGQTLELAGYLAVEPVLP